jgi:hypothetical protein
VIFLDLTRPDRLYSAVDQNAKVKEARSGKDRDISENRADVSPSATCYITQHILRTREQERDESVQVSPSDSPRWTARADSTISLIPHLGW